MITTLYENTETEFMTNGLGRLVDATECIVSERLNDFYTLHMIYPKTGICAGDLVPGRLILADPAEGVRSQPFRIRDVTKSLSGELEIYADHLSYDLAGYPIRKVTAATAAAAVAALASRAIIAPPFTFSTDLSVSKAFETEAPASIRSIMGGDDKTIQGVYGGEWLFDRYEASLLAARGSDNGVTIRYGKNLTGLDLVWNNEEGYTGALAYYQNDTTYVSSNVQYLNASAVPPKIMIVDHSSDFETTPTTAQLDTLARADLAGISGSIRSLTVSFAPLWQTEEFRNVSAIERVGLGDYVTVVYDEFDVNEKLEVVQTDYNVLLERYDKIELGAIRESLADTIASMKK